MTSKYHPLQVFLETSGLSRIRMTFSEIERILGFSLPNSKTYPAWWSNSTTNNTMTKVWLAAGYRTSEVDTVGEALTFVRDENSSINAGTEDTQPARPRSPLFGSMKGTTIVAPGVDLTKPADPEWATMYDKEPIELYSGEIDSIRSDPNLNVSQKIRALSAAGVSRAEIARLLNKRYQHVRNVLVDAERKAG